MTLIIPLQFFTPNLFLIFQSWVLTVLGFFFKIAAISLKVYPSTYSFATFLSTCDNSTEPLGLQISPSSLQNLPRRGHLTSSKLRQSSIMSEDNLSSAPKLHRIKRSAMLKFARSDHCPHTNSADALMF